MKFEKLEIKIRHSLGARILVILWGTIFYFKYERALNFLSKIFGSHGHNVSRAFSFTGTHLKCSACERTQNGHIDGSKRYHTLYPFMCTPKPQVHTLRWYVDLVCILFSIKDWFFEWTIRVSSSSVTSWKACQRIDLL